MATRFRSSGKSAARAWSASTWSWSTTAATSSLMAFSQAGERPGVPRPSATTTAKPLVGEPLRREVGVVRGHHALTVRATVRVQEHGEGGVTVVVPWHKHGARDTARPLR